MNAKTDVAVIKPNEQAENRTLTPMDMLDRAVQSGANIEVLEKLMGLQERWEKNQARKEFDEAMSAAKSEMPIILKNRSVSHGEGKTAYRHEDLAEISRTIDPVLSKHGLSYRFRTQVADGRVNVTCIVSHRGGHSEENALTASPDASGAKNSVQAIGSTLSYLQRYALKAALGLAAAADDDAQSAGSASTITDEQAQEIVRLVNETNASVEKFLKWASAPSISDIRASQFNDCVAMLHAKQQKKARQ